MVKRVALNLNALQVTWR